MSGRRNVAFALFLIVAVLFATYAIANAQSTKKPFRVGPSYLETSLTRADKAFRDSLRTLGYVEGQNIVIDWRRAKGDAGKYPAFAAEVVGPSK